MIKRITFGKYVTEILVFVVANAFFQLNLVFITDSHTGFFFSTLSSKTRVKTVLSPVLAFLITYTSGTNWYALISVP